MLIFSNYKNRHDLITNVVQYLRSCVAFGCHFSYGTKNLAFVLDFGRKGRSKNNAQSSYKQQQIVEKRC